MNQQLFSEQEAGEIIRRASEITEASSSADYKPGITHEELEKIEAMNRTREFVYCKQVMSLVILELWHRVFIDKAWDFTEA